MRVLFISAVILVMFAVIATFIGSFRQADHLVNKPYFMAGILLLCAGLATMIVWLLFVFKKK